MSIKTGPARNDTNGKFSRRIVRGTGLTVATILSGLILSAVLPPLVADQSDRAVVNAPATLLTAPIAGEIESLPVRVGQRLEAGDTVARLANARVDRSTLILLEGKSNETRERMLAAARKRKSNVDYLAALDASMAQEIKQLKEIFGGQIAELKARVAVATASIGEKQAGVDRLSTMVAKNINSPDMLKPVEQQRAAAAYNKEAEQAKLSQKVAQLEGLNRGVFVGEELAGLAALAQKRRDIAFDAERLGIEETELAAALRDQQSLLEAERQRLAILSSGEIKAPAAGEILRIGVAPGRHVAAGDTLGSMVSCDQAFVVAIFSYRQGQNLRVGSRVDLTGPTLPTGQSGTVTEILPKTSDKVDELYAVPFPQTERRELYVLVDPDRAPAAAVQSSPRAACDVGQWVTVSRQNAWVPSTSVVWRSIGERTTAISEGLVRAGRALAAAPSALTSPRS